MEVLGNSNKTEDIIIADIANLNKSLLSSYDFDDQIDKCITLLSTVIDMGDMILHEPHVITLINILNCRKELTAQIPLLDNLVTEITLKSIRITTLGTQCPISADDIKPLSTEKERWVPDERNQFFLPDAGETTNLTVTEPDLKHGKVCIREVIIDHNGYLVEEISRRYEDIYNDESEEVFNTAYLDEIKKSK